MKLVVGLYTSIAPIESDEEAKVRERNRRAPFLTSPSIPAPRIEYPGYLTTDGILGAASLSVLQNGEATHTLENSFLIYSQQIHLEPDLRAT